MNHLTWNNNINHLQYHLWNYQWNMMMLIFYAFYLYHVVAITIFYLKIYILLSLMAPSRYHYRIILFLCFIDCWIVIRMVLIILINCLLNSYSFCFIFADIYGIFINFWIYFFDVDYGYYNIWLCDTFKFYGNESLACTYWQHI